MSNFLHSGYTDLNSLTKFDADEIRTQTLYVNGILIEPNSNIFDNITCTNLICQNDISSNKIYATTSIQNVPVAKYAFLTNVSSDIQSQFNSLKTQADKSTTLLTGASWNAPYQFLDLSYNLHVWEYLYIGSNNLNVNDILNSLPTTYVSVSSLATTLLNYCLQSDYLALKVITDGLANILVNVEHIGGFGINFYEGINVFGSMLVTVNGNSLNVGSILNGLSSTYCLQSNYLTLKTQADLTTLKLTNT